jgi:hypothetical protein
MSDLVWSKNLIRVSAEVNKLVVIERDFDFSIQILSSKPQERIESQFPPKTEGR